MSSHPYDTNDYDDVPDGTRIVIPITFSDRIEAVCLDPHHCTIANAITRTADTTGILDLGRRGVGRTYVSMLLDPTVHPWATPGRWYRARLTESSAALAAELDDLAASPSAAKAHRSALKRVTAALPDGPAAIWANVTLVAPPPSERKGYRSGEQRRGRTGSGSKRRGSIRRRSWKARPKSATD